MDNNFKEDLEIVMKKDISKLVKLSDIIKKNENRVYRGEINILDNENNILSQTHYEFFTLILSEKLIMIERYSNENNATTLDYTNVSVDKITDYKISSTSFKLEGQLSENIKISILAVFLDR